MSSFLATEYLPKNFFAAVRRHSAVTGTLVIAQFLNLSRNIFEWYPDVF